MHYWQCNRAKPFGHAAGRHCHCQCHQHKPTLDDGAVKKMPESETAIRRENYDIDDPTAFILAHSRVYPSALDGDLSHDTSAVECNPYRHFFAAPHRSRVFYELPAPTVLALVDRERSASFPDKVADRGVVFNTSLPYNDSHFGSCRYHLA